MGMRLSLNFIRTALMLMASATMAELSAFLFANTFGGIYAHFTRTHFSHWTIPCRLFRKAQITAACRYAVDGHFAWPFRFGSKRTHGRDEFISQIGTITIGKSSVKIAPRKNQYADYYELTPIKIEW